MTPEYNETSDAYAAYDEGVEAGIRQERERVSRALLSNDSLNVGVRKSFDRSESARTHLIRAVVPMLHHIGIKPIGLDGTDEYRAADMLREYGDVTTEESEK